MIFRLLADGVVVIHLAIIVVIVVGAIGWLRYRWWPWFHLPIALYGVAIEWIGWTCPLTPLENWLRVAAGDNGYGGGFVEHYLIPIIYPERFTDQMALMLGTTVLGANLLLYGWIGWRRRRRSLK